MFKFIQVKETETKGAVVVESSDSTSTDMILNAGIMAGLGFFSTVAGLMASGLTSEPISACFTAGISTGLQFFTSLALQRGLKK